MASVVDHADDVVTRPAARRLSFIDSAAAQM
jgi:hypothetical protein